MKILDANGHVDDDAYRTVVRRVRMKHGRIRIEFEPYVTDIGKFGR